MKITSRRAAIVLTGALVVAAPAGAVWLSSAPAQAAAASRLVANVTKLQASAGTCTTFQVTPVDQFGVVSNQPDTVTVSISENPSSNSQDADFCVPNSPTANPADTFSADRPVEDPSYVAQSPNAASPPAGTNAPRSGPRTYYKAGDTITDSCNGVTPCSHNAGGDPDNADSGTGFGGDPTHTNPSGVDAARYLYTPGQPITVGVVGLAPGSVNINAFFDTGSRLNPQDNNDYVAQSEEIQTGNIPFTVTDGGYPGEAAVTAAPTAIEAQPADGAGTPGSVQTFSVVLRNSSGDTVRGVTPLIRVASTGANPNAPARCFTPNGNSTSPPTNNTGTNNSGVATCTFQGTSAGTDTLTVYVNKVGGTSGPDANEAQTTVIRTTTKQAVVAAEARYIDLTPRTPTTVAGTNRTFTAAVTDVNGAPAQGASVLFTESGPGQFSNGTSSSTGVTDATGRVSVIVVTAASDSGVETVNAAITTTPTQCSQQAGFGDGSNATTPAGRCTDSTTHTISKTAASPSPSASASASASATPSSSPSPSPSRSGARQALTIATETPDIQPNDTGIYDVTGQPNSSIELRCYTRPNTDYFTARGPVNLTSGGDTQFRILPGANTRCYVRYASDDATASGSVVINVHTTLSLSTVRTGTRNYVFQGRNLPRRSGQLITLYRVDSSGREIRTSNLTTDSSGIYRVTRQFTGTGTFEFKVRTSQTLNNAAGVSNTITVAVR